MVFHSANRQCTNLLPVQQINRGWKPKLESILELK